MADAATAPPPADASDRPGPPRGFAFLPWLLLGAGSFANLLRGETPDPWIGGAGLLLFNTLYIAVVSRAWCPRRRKSRSTWWLLAAQGAVTCTLAAGYGDSWLLFLPLFALACGTVLRGRVLFPVLIPLSVFAGAVGWAGGEGITYTMTIGYGTLMSGLMASALVRLADTVRELDGTRQELARSAVERERLRFSRDLHDLLGHTLSVVVVKAEAVRRLASRDLGAALAQAADIESVGRRALIEVRDAVTGYRAGSLDTELDRARSALGACGIEAVVRQSGPPLEPRTEALLGWVVREGVTNTVRHSGADRCEIEVRGSSHEVLLEITDDGRGGAGERHTAGTGLTGLAERMADAGGFLDAGPRAGGGFRVTAGLPAGAEYEREGGLR
ncbi:sensor histidine kinase [Streptomyces meridianus]|uniref:Sensor histidine kinase n=1 Tax=Streptomyces meridianus TaxID=2938945 RepID=A0ABT0XAK5_9ACTN|nr:sensor histidine kinase [Streptomyces meridianus]MCM2579330.1 sensor histidine kinase [Streptomyces meridianus]